MKKYEIKNSVCTVLYSSNSHNRGYFAWPSVAQIDDNKIMVVCSGFREAHQDPYGKVIGFISCDNGKSWSEPITIANSVLDDRDSGIVYFKDKIYVTWFTAKKQTYIGANSGSDYDKDWDRYCSQISDNENEKFFKPLYVVSEDNGKTFSEIKYAPVFSPHGMVKSNENRLFYVGYRPQENFALYLTKSDDGENWGQLNQFVSDERVKNEKLYEPTCLPLKDGRILILVRSEIDGIKELYATEKESGVYDFSEMTLVTPTKKSPPHLLRLKNGNILLTYCRRETPLGVFCRVSEDEGKTWSDELVVYLSEEEMNDKPNSWDMGYPATVELENGKMLTVFYERVKYSDNNTAIKQIFWNLK